MLFVLQALSVLCLFYQTSTATYVCNSSNAHTAVASGSSNGTPAGSSKPQPTNTNSNCPADVPAMECLKWQTSNTGNSLLTSAVKLKLRSLSLQKRANYATCQDTDVCVAVQQYFMCIDPTTRYFEDNNGGRGNLNNYVYTMSNGQVTTMASTATGFPTPTAAGMPSQASQSPGLSDGGKTEVKEMLLIIAVGLALSV